MQSLAVSCNWEDKHEKSRRGRDEEVVKSNTRCRMFWDRVLRILGAGSALRAISPADSLQRSQPRARAEQLLSLCPSSQTCHVLCGPPNPPRYVTVVDNGSRSLLAHSFGGVFFKVQFGRVSLATKRSAKTISSLCSPGFFFYWWVIFCACFS